MKLQYYYMPAAEINCHYLMTQFCCTQFKCASVLGLIRAFWPQKGFWLIRAY